MITMYFAPLRGMPNGTARLTRVQSLPTPNSFRTIPVQYGIGQIYEADIAVAYQQGWVVADTGGPTLTISLLAPDGSGGVIATSAAVANDLLAQGYLPGQ